ncbi:RAMP superfamily CRISPR-associated protein [Actinomadura napierensis]|uniref:CRISPR type III-associated protein domain-containing protein n=1 Tax=Actinomadura napierensis TaxID=267854 RepID=A0ABN3ADY9_9ACTN
MTDRTGRPMDRRLRVRGWLRVQTPLHVGGIALDPADALPVAVDGQGHVYVPGTGLAGALRNWMRGTDTRRGALDDLWGFVPDGVANAGNASRAVLRDAVIATSTAFNGYGLPRDPIDPVTLPTRHGVGIDRFTGAAASEFLYTRTVVPPGSYLGFEMDIESTTEHQDEDRRRLAALLAALSAEEIQLGGATRRGLGTVSLLQSPLSVHEHDLTKPSGLLAILRGRPADARLETAALPDRRALLRIRIDWEPAAPVMVRESGEGPAIGTLPLTTRLNGESLGLTLTGGSIKGALRSHAEFIERTARQVCAPNRPAANATPREHSDSFRDQLDQLPAVRNLFGAGRSRTGGAAGALTAHECVSRTRIPAKVWKALTDAPPGTDPQERPKLSKDDRKQLNDLGMDQADHVAIDRWTGGASHSRLYSVLEPHAIDWEPINLTVDLTHLGESQDAELALLLLVLRDLANRRIPLGGMVTRGFGDITVLSTTLTGGRWPDGTTLAKALEEPQLDEAWKQYLSSTEVNA